MGVAITLVIIVIYSPTNFSSTNAQAQAESRASSQQPSPNVQRLHDLTAQLLELSQEINAKSKDITTDVHPHPWTLIEQLAGERRALLIALMQKNPGQVLAAALPSHIRKTLPEKLQSYFEEEVQLDGELEVIYEDYETEARLRHFLKSGDKRTELHFQEASTPHLLTGTKVRVSGVRVGSDIALYSGGGETPAGMQITQTAQAPGFNSLGEQKVLLMLVNFQDKATQPFTADSARNVMFNSVSNFNYENSYGQTWLTGDVAGWFTIPTSYTTCDTSAIAYYAKQAAQAAGYNLANYNRYVYTFPSAACGGWAGMAYFGGNPSQAWINGAFSLSVVGHELGHNYGLYHSKSLDCGSQVIGAIGSGCTSSEYGDSFDIMGTGSRHFNAFQKEQIGWLNYGSSPAITTVQTSGTYWIDSYAAPGGTKALKILKSTDPKTGVKTWYYAEARRAVGFDSSVSSNSNVLNGVILHTGPDSGGTPVYLLDMTPETTSWSDPALVVGKGFTDSNAGVTITTVSATSLGSLVNVSYGPAPCLSANPTVSMSPSTSGWVAPGTAVNYTVSVSNHDTSGCFPSSFNLQASVPGGWTGSFTNSILSIGPGATVSTKLTVTSPLTMPEGSYNIPVSAGNMGNINYSAATVVTYSAVASLSITAMTDRGSYTRNQTVATTATVKAMGLPVSGAAVRFTLTKADGSQVTGTVVTGSNGTAVYKYKFKRNDPVGSYLNVAASTVNGLSGSATTGFMVQ
jgi:hypothetical protein